MDVFSLNDINLVSTHSSHQTRRPDCALGHINDKTLMGFSGSRIRPRGSRKAGLQMYVGNQEGVHVCG